MGASAESSATNVEELTSCLEVCFGVHFYVLGVWLAAGRLKGDEVLLVVVSVTGQV